MMRWLNFAAVLLCIFVLHSHWPTWFTALVAFAFFVNLLAWVDGLGEDLRDV